MLTFEYSADASDRWALPSQAVDTLVDYCLKEDQDEVVKHYAVKVSICICMSISVCHDMTL